MGTGAGSGGVALGRGVGGRGCWVLGNPSFSLSILSGKGQELWHGGAVGEGAGAHTGARGVGDGAGAEPRGRRVGDRRGGGCRRELWVTEGRGAKGRRQHPAVTVLVLFIVVCQVVS